jgi:hypothetical protein
MGSGKPRSNIVPVSAGAQVVTSDGGGALVCDFDDVLRAFDTTLGAGEEIGVLAVIEGAVLLRLADRALVLVDDYATRRLSNCIERGYRFRGSVVSEGLVRVWNEPSQ